MKIEWNKKDYSIEVEYNPKEDDHKKLRELDKVLERIGFELEDWESRKAYSQLNLSTGLYITPTRYRDHFHPINDREETRPMILFYTDNAIELEDGGMSALDLLHRWGVEVDIRTIEGKWEVTIGYYTDTRRRAKGLSEAIKISAKKWIKCGRHIGDEGLEEMLDDYRGPTKKV